MNDKGPSEANPKKKDGPRPSIRIHRSEKKNSSCFPQNNKEASSQVREKRLFPNRNNWKECEGVLGGDRKAPLAFY